MSALALIANAYNPSLLVISIFLSIFYGIKYRSFRGVLLFVTAIIAYSLMFIDKHFSLWDSVGLDYSTHTATSLGMCIFIGSTLKGNKSKITLIVSLLTYFQMMVVLNYHSWADILTTALPVGLLCGIMTIYAAKSKYLARR